MSFAQFLATKSTLVQASRNGTEVNLKHFRQVFLDAAILFPKDLFKVLEKMGWVLEIAKMCIYISFPVGIFHYVNQPEYFEKYVIKTKEEYYPPESRQKGEQMENFIREFNTIVERKHLDTLERQNKQ